MKEEPNTKFYFDRKIARVVFEDDEERKVYWVDTTELHNNYRLRFLHHRHHFLHHYFYYIRDHLLLLLLLPIEEWLKEQGMTCVEDDMCLFELTWV